MLVGDAVQKRSLGVFRAVAGRLLLLAARSALTEARTSVVPMKLRPVVETVAALCLLLGSVAR